MYMISIIFRINNNCTSQVYVPVVGHVALSKQAQARWIAIECIRRYMRKLRPRSFQHFEASIPEKYKINLYAFLGSTWLKSAQEWYTSHEYACLQEENCLDFRGKLKLAHNRRYKLLQKYDPEGLTRAEVLLL